MDSSTWIVALIIVLVSLRLVNANLREIEYVIVQLNRIRQRFK
ncbi:hypothetical protein [Methanosarcina horonobensis]|nr:hypothetical protein [Methanosarcina horonobensis]